MHGYGWLLHAAYHGTATWGWPMAIMAVGLPRQLGLCSSARPLGPCSDSTIALICSPRTSICGITSRAIRRTNLSTAA